jgi:hypothetical protein
MRAVGMWAGIVIAAGCNRLFGIDQIPYAGPVDAARGDSGSGAIDADLGPLDLTVELTGTTVGSVVDDQMGLTCTGASGTTCVQHYPGGTRVTLMASATFPAEFAAWGGVCLDQNANDPPTCVLATGGALTVTADFESGDVLNLIPSNENQADGVNGAYIGVDGMQCQSGSTCTYLFPSDTVSETLKGHSTTCATLQALTGPGCTLPPDCIVEFGSAHVVTVDYSFILGNGSGCSQ